MGRAGVVSNNYRRKMSTSDGVVPVSARLCRRCWECCGRPAGAVSALRVHVLFWRADIKSGNPIVETLYSVSIWLLCLFFGLYFAWMGETSNEHPCPRGFCQGDPPEAVGRRGDGQPRFCTNRELQTWVQNHEGGGGMESGGAEE